MAFADTNDESQALYASGIFASAGGHASVSFARWGCANGPVPCSADIAPGGGDGTVDIDDLLFVISNWGQSGVNPADVNGDNTVNIADLLAVVAAWGPCL